DNLLDRKRLVRGELKVKLTLARAVWVAFIVERNDLPMRRNDCNADAAGRFNVRRKEDRGGKSDDLLRDLLVVEDFTYRSAVKCGVHPLIHKRLNGTHVRVVGGQADLVPLVAEDDAAHRGVAIQAALSLAEPTT